jgi:formylglycine-generating enzyme required for sulfatase activity
LLKILNKLFLLIFCLECVYFFTVCDIAVAKGEIYTNSIGMEFILVPSGKFIMSGDADRWIRREITISKSFYLGKYEVTQAQWASVMGKNSSVSTNKPDNPVANVSFDDVQEFIKRLNTKEGHNRYRLPTEAEWEYAATAGSNWGHFFYFKTYEERWKYAWEKGNSGGFSRPVGQKLPNPWGFHDIIGNLSEWTNDWYDYDYYDAKKYPSVDPRGPSVQTSDNPNRVIRGGNSGVDTCSTTSRSYFEGSDPGFRLAMDE